MTTVETETPFELESLKVTYNLCMSKMKQLMTPTTEVQQLTEAIRHASATNRMGTDDDFAEFVNSDLAISIMQKLAKTISADEQYIEAVADMMEAFADLYVVELANKRYHEQYTCAMTWCFQPEVNLHKRNFQMSDDDLKKLSTSKQEWRNNLKVGDKLDVNIIGDEKNKTKGWAQGVIERISNEVLSLIFPDLPTDYDQDVACWSTDIAQFETHTKEDYAWRRSWGTTESTDFVCDMHDKFKWEEGTVFHIHEDDQSGRNILLAKCGFRVYREEGKKLRQDAEGRTFDGWSEKYDEFIPVFSPRIQMHMSRVNQTVFDDDDIDEDLDEMISPEPGHSRVYCVPRLNGCLSSRFIHLMNKFGNTRGFELILDTLANQECNEKLTLTVMGYMITMISMPSKLWHKDWLADNAVPFGEAMKKQLLSAPDKILKDVTANDVNQMQISINSLNQRVMDKEEAKRASEFLKLEITKKCLSSELLERRILGIKELNQIIRNAQIAYGSIKVFTMEQLINWMSEHGVFDILWDPKKTHLQLVQRSNEIFKILPKEDLLSMTLLKQFWTLSKSDYKSEVFKIINEAAYHLNQEHIEYLFDQITETAANKLGMEEFDALASLGRYSKSYEFSNKTSEFFWKIITDSDEHKQDLIENCINKFSDMIKYKSMDDKKPYFDKLVPQMSESRSSAVPVIRLFKKIIKDQKTKIAYSGNNYGGNATTTTGGTTVVNHGATTTADGKTVYSKSYGTGSESIYPNNSQPQGGNAGAADEEEKQEEEATVKSVLNALQEKGFVQALLANLDTYCQSVAAKVASDSALLREKDRTKLFILNTKHSHQDEMNERLSFLQEFAVNSDFKISKAQLKVIYDLLTKSPIKSDFTEFLMWCNTACQAQNAITSVLDLEEVGEFFSELIKNKSLDLTALPVVGFEFLKIYFTSTNLEQRKLQKIVVPEKKKTNAYNGGYYSTWSNTNAKKDDEVEPSDDDATFKVNVDPSLLTKIDMMWAITLECQDEAVISKATAFLVNCYLSVADELEDRRTSVLQSLNAQCFELIKSNQDKPQVIKRIVKILQDVIRISEKKGTGGVQPHNAILKGEMFDRVIVRYMVKNKQSYQGLLKLDRSVVVKLFTSATVWEFKKEVSSMLGLSPKYIKLTMPNKDVIKDNQHGMTLQELDLKNGDILTAEKLSIVENIVEAPLVDFQKGCLVPRAVEIFTEWYDIYKNEETGLMDAAHVAKFIAGATKQECDANDNRVQGILSKYDNDKDGQLNLQEFLDFYYQSSSGQTLKAVHSNLKNHNVRLDLKRMSEIVEEVSFAEHEMPRHTLSSNQEQFQALFGLLDRNDDTSEDVWNLVRMLATNQQMYQEVLSLSESQQADGAISWAKVFEDQSLYKQIYKQEIIMAVMEQSSADDEGKRVMYVEDQKIASNYTTGTANTTNQTGGAAEETKQEQQESTVDTAATTSQATENDEVQKLKANWTKQFLEKEGWNYILDSFMSKEVSSAETVTFSEQASLKDLSFLMTLLRVFLEAGFKSQQGDISQAMRLVRKSSSIGEEGDLASKKAQADEDQFVELMKSPSGQEVMLNSNFEQLFDKLMQLLATIMSKATLILEDKIIIESALAIVVGILLFRNDVYARFISFTSQSAVQNTEQIALAGLLCVEEKVRIDFERSLGVLAQSLQRSEQNALYFLLGVLARNFASISNKPSRQFFELFNKLIDSKARRDDLMGIAADDSSAIYDPEDLLNQTIDKIKQQQRLKQEQSLVEDQGDEIKALEEAAEQERLLVGLVTLTGKIIAKADKAVSDRIISQKDLIGQIFKDFLFASYYQSLEDQNNSGPIVIQQQIGSRNDKKKAQAPQNKSREAAYELLHQLIQGSANLMKKFLEEQLLPLIKTIKKPKNWRYVPPTSSERHQKYCGLVNLGCICYMNSMMQQFFMVPAFRYNLLCVDDGKPEDLKEYKGEKVDDNMMHQLQKLIAHLELSQRNDYNPAQFCFAFKEFDGTPTNTAEQKDAQEFLNLMFDRLEDALKHTSRKHLVSSIFGGQQCSQMVCTECGKVKNRMEDYLNLSIPVKGIKSIEESLAKQVEGEIINDYQCDGCNRKVDLQKRTMIASTPNILIVHLQRICFNFDTFQNDKINSFCSFPNVLDLKPYSFHEVMGKENRLKEQEGEDEGGLSQQNQQREQDMTDEEKLAKKEAEDEAREPERDDCYEYKLVGVNVHSGTANAGHYWSYINTNRGTDEQEGVENDSWIKTEQDPWMEYNDSRVSDWEFKDMRQRTFGNEQKANQNAYFSSLGDSYGTSAYMLFYERRVKKDIKVLVADDQVEANKSKGITVEFDEEKKEHFKMVNYRKSADGELANDFYKKVSDDNQKFTFESNIYSTEFFDFILQILQSVAESNVDDATKMNGLNIGTKVGFEILARMAMNPGIDRVAQVMIDILKSRPDITKGFVAQMCDFPNSEVFWEVLFDCGEPNTQKHLARVIKFALCQLKMDEKSSAIAQETVTVEREVTALDGTTQMVAEEQPKAICVRFIHQMVEMLQERAPKAWRKFDAYLDVFFSFMVNSADEIAEDKDTYDNKSDACKTGIELYFIYNMVRHLGDFILQENSPYQEPGTVRTVMGGNYGSPNLSAALKTIIIMISEKDMMEKYPLDEKNSEIVSHKDILQKMIEPGEGANQSDFSDILLDMAKDNAKISKKMAKSYLKNVNKTSIESLNKALQQIRGFLKINDSLKQQRMEWIFGIPQVISKSNYKTRQQQYGSQILEMMADEYYQFKSASIKGIQEAFLGQLQKAKGRMDTQCVVGLKNLIEMCLEDHDVGKYVWNQPAPTLQYARYTDWFFPYAQALKQNTLNQVKNTTTMLDYHKNRLELLEAILSMMPDFLKMKEPWAAEEQAKLTGSVGETSFIGYQSHALHSQVDEVIVSYPPAYVVGPTVTDEANILLTKDTELATVTLEEVTAEYMYSNPQGIYNLTLPEKLWTNQNYQQISYASWKMAQLRAAGVEEMPDLPVCDWKTQKLTGPTIMKVMVKSKSPKMARVGVKLTVADNANKNVIFPMSEIKENLFSNDSKQAFVFLKIDPSKDTWGDIECEVIVKPGKTTQMSTGYTSSSYNTGYSNYGTTGYYGGQNGYTQMGVGITTTSTSTSYKPIGYDSYDTKLNCVNCQQECFVGEDYCGKCGKSPTELDDGV